MREEQVSVLDPRFPSLYIFTTRNQTHALSLHTQGEVFILKNSAASSTTPQGRPAWKAFPQLLCNCCFSHDVTKIQTKRLPLLPRFYFHDALEQLKIKFHTNFRSKRVLGFVIEYAWISKLLRDVAFTWRPRELSCRLKKWLISGSFAI